jgi:hypothetical protein
MANIETGAERAVDTPAERRWPADPYDKALAAERQLQPIARMVEAFAALAPAPRSRKSMCAGCIWDLILKPLVRPILGWDRGYPPEQAPAEPRDSWQPMDLEALLAEDDEARPEPDNEIERWLRSSEAWEVVTDRWLKTLDHADPGNGHGIGHRSEAAS